MELSILENAAASGQCVFVLSGRINATSAPDLKHRIKDVVAAGQTRLVMDMAGVSFIDSSGLSALISGLRCAREAGGSFRIASLHDQAYAVVKLMNMDRVFEIYESAEAASKG
jgi:anti-sigma B factor antagonist